VDISSEDFRQHFELLSDETLLATRREDLVAAAQAVYDAELEKRGLVTDEAVELAGEVVPDDEEEAAAEATEAPEELVSVGEFTVIDEARIARGLLQSAEIPAGLANDKMSLGLLHLMVPASFVEAALQVLGGEISEEELAAQAEAAGFSEHEG
jgi:predicted amidohydrolase YtcJ